MEKFLYFAMLILIIVFIVSLVGFMFSIHWTLGIASAMFVWKLF